MSETFKTIDTGARRNFETGAKRDVDEGKPRYDLLPVSALQRWALLLARGATKYSDRNWERGMPVSVFVASGLRHAYAYLEGDRTEDHLAAILFNFGAIVEMEELVREGLLPDYFLDEGASMATIAEGWIQRVHDAFRGQPETVQDVRVRHGDVFIMTDKGAVVMDGRDFSGLTSTQLLEVVREELTRSKSGV
jgi:hypothetical protein